MSIWELAIWSECDNESYSFCLKFGWLVIYGGSDTVCSVFLCEDLDFWLWGRFVTKYYYDCCYGLANINIQMA